MNRNNAKLVTAVGLPCSGKSSIMLRTAEICRTKCFVEPEENEWPDAVHKRRQVGYATAITWFRSVRVPLIFKADDLRRQGHTVFVDSYYDKLISKYIGLDGMEWLIPSDDPYYPVIFSLAELDYEHLPDADCVISFYISETKWLEMLEMRNRNLDKTSGLSKTYRTQKLFINAAKIYCLSKGIPHIVFKNEANGVDAAAKDLVTQLKDNNIIHL